MNTIILERVNENNSVTFVNLFNIYHHDRAKFLPGIYQEVDDEGYYDKPNTQSIMSDYPEKVISYIIKHNGNAAGFVVLAMPPYVKSGNDYAIVDLFVLNNFRGKGVAANACKWLFENHPGRYWMEVVKKDSDAISYWVNLIAKHGSIVSINEVDFLLVEFEFDTN